MKGPGLPKFTASEWIQTLSSTNDIEVLSTLVWLSGIHLSSKEVRSPNVFQEKISDSKIFEKVKDAVETKQALKQLAKSKNPWIKDYAITILYQK
jgi:hypothetical protein